MAEKRRKVWDDESPPSRNRDVSGFTLINNDIVKSDKITNQLIDITLNIADIALQDQDHSYTKIQKNLKSIIGDRMIKIHTIPTAPPVPNERIENPGINAEPSFVFGAKDGNSRESNSSNYDK